MLDIDVASKDEALWRIAEAVAQAHGLEAGPVARALQRREQAASTGLGHGFALPHARIEGLRRPVTVFLRTGRGIDFDAPDGQPVRDVFAIVVPWDGSQQAHLDLLAAVTRRFADEDFRRRLDTASTPAAALAAFRSGEKPAA